MITNQLKRGLTLSSVYCILSHNGIVADRRVIICLCLSFFNIPNEGLFGFTVPEVSHVRSNEVGAIRLCLDIRNVKDIQLIEYNIGHGESDCTIGSGYKGNPFGCLAPREVAYRIKDHCLASPCPSLGCLSYHNACTVPGSKALACAKEYNIVAIFPIRAMGPGAVGCSRCHVGTRTTVETRSTEEEIRCAKQRTKGLHDRCSCWIGRRRGRNYQFSGIFGQ